AVLVERSEQRLDTAVGVAGRQARVARSDPSGEGVGGDVHPPATGLDADPAQRPRYSRPLRREGYLERSRRRVDASRADERRQRQGQRPKQAAELPRAQPEVVVVQERLVWALILHRKAVPIGSGELEISRQRRGERPEVVTRPRQAPALLAVRARPGELG